MLNNQSGFKLLINSIYDEGVLRTDKIFNTFTTGTIMNGSSLMTLSWVICLIKDLLVVYKITTLELHIFHIFCQFSVIIFYGNCSRIDEI